MKFKSIIEKAHESGNLKQFEDIFENFLSAIESGEIRSAKPVENGWETCGWVKRGILLGFKFGKIVEYKRSEYKTFLDKSTFPERNFSLKDSIRVVPGGTSIRRGAHVGSSVIIMPPSYVNVGAFVDDGTLIDSHALVGTCAQIGKNVHLSAAAQIGGVIEPIGANPVIVEDNVFIGGNCGIYEGVIVKQNAIIAAGVILTAGTPVYDAVNDRFLEKIKGKPVTIPQNAVVVSGSRPLKENSGFSVYCPIIIKYRDEKSDNSVELETLIR